MAEPVIRELQPTDIPALTALWREVFGDDEALIGEFFRLLPVLGGGVAAEMDGRPVGAAYLLTDLFLGDKRAGYLYAVAVSPESRGLGLGKGLSLAAAALGRRLGADFLCTLPANAGLYPWYEGLIGTRHVLHRREERIESRAAEEPRPISAEEYGARREALLMGQPHLRPGAAYLRFQEALCQSYGGGLYAVGEGLAAAYRDGDRCLVRELIAPEGTDRTALAASLGAALGAQEADLYSPAPAGEPYLAADCPLPEDCVWNLTLD